MMVSRTNRNTLGVLRPDLQFGKRSPPSSHLRLTLPLVMTVSPTVLKIFIRKPARLFMTPARP